MKKNPTEFRKRFNAYKKGKDISEIYNFGLPEYDDGDDLYDVSEGARIGAIPFTNAPTEFYPKIKSAEEYAKSYYNSPGFEERLNKTQLYLGNNYNIRKSPELRIRNIYYSDDPKLKGTAYYEALADKKNIYNIVIGETLSDMQNYDTTAAHELGHAIDNSISIESPNGMYHKYSDFVTPLNTDKGSLFNRNIKNNKENYANLLALRYYLYNTGLFDSRVKGQKFDKNKYDELIKRKDIPYPINDFLQRFFPHRVILMINDYVYNNKIKNPYYDTV